MIKRCAVTGSFDPVTIGHVNLVERALKIFDEVCVLMLINPDKEYFFTKDERFKMLEQTFAQYERVEVAFYDGYTADYCKSHGIGCLIRGVRNSKDFEYEKKLAKANFDYGGIETLFLDSDGEYDDISSNAVRNMIIEGKNYQKIVPERAINVIKEKNQNG